MKSRLLSIGLLSSAIIAFQLSLMQLLSITQWYHFAYMVISIALLGFGAAGTFLSLFRKRLLENFELLFSFLMILSGFFMAIVPCVSQLFIFRFDSYLLFSDYSHILKLIATYLLFFIPFFFGALSIGLTFTKYAGEIGTLYFANLAGSSAGGIIVLVLMWYLMPQNINAVIAFLPITAGIICVRRFWLKIVILVSFACIIIFIVLIRPVNPVMSEFKSLSKVLDLPDSEILSESNSPYGLLQIASSSALRYAPGLSLRYQGVVPVQDVVFNNGHWFGPIVDSLLSDSVSILNYTSQELPYVMSKRKRVLIIEGRTGIDAAHALGNGAEEITIVESNSAAISALRDYMCGNKRLILDHSNVSVQISESRTFLEADRRFYDLITMPVIGAFGGNAGLNALHEHYFLTKGAFIEMLEKLTENGVISVTCWMDYPSRYPLRMLSTIVEALSEKGISAPVKHIAAVRSWNTITYVVKKTHVNSDEASKVRKFCNAMYFDPAILFDIDIEERSSYNILQDNDFFKYLDTILYTDRVEFYSDYDFNVQPARDDSPYFFQFLRWKSIFNVAELFGRKTFPFFELAYVILILTLIQVAVIAFLLIIVPLFRHKDKMDKKTGIFLYFTGIGLGYMFVEIVLIQRFIMYFGSALYASASVICSMLVFSGIGSQLSSRLVNTKRIFFLVFFVIVALLLIYTVYLTEFLFRTTELPLGLKIVMAMIVIAPLAFFMGMPFPAGIRYLQQKCANAIPWAWGINGCFSVVGAVIAIIIAVEYGFVFVMLFASLSYVLSFIGRVKFG